MVLYFFFLDVFIMANPNFDEFDELFLEDENRGRAEGLAAGKVKIYTEGYRQGWEVACNIIEQLAFMETVVKYILSSKDITSLQRPKVSQSSASVGGTSLPERRKAQVQTIGLEKKLLRIQEQVQDKRYWMNLFVTGGAESVASELSVLHTKVKSFSLRFNLNLKLEHESKDVDF